MKRFSINLKTVKIGALVVLGASSVLSISNFAMPSKAYASSTLPLASSQMSGTGWSIDSNGNLTISTGSTVDLDTIVQSEWGTSYNPNDQPTFNNVAVNGTLTTGSSYHDLEFNAQGTVTVATGGKITMTGMSPGVTGGDGTGLGGGAGVDGNGGNGGGTTNGGTTQANQIYGGNASTDNSPTGGVGGGHIRIHAKDVEVDGQITDDGTSGQGGQTSGLFNGSAGGGGGLIELDAPTVNFASGSNVSALGGGGGGGAGAPSTPMNGTPLLLSEGIVYPATNGVNGLNGNGSIAGNGGNGGKGNPGATFKYPTQMYDASSGASSGGIQQMYSSGQDAPDYYTNSSRSNYAIGYLSSGAIVASIDNELEISNGNNTWIDTGRVLGGFASDSAIYNGTLYDLNPNGLYKYTVSSNSWTLITPLPSYVSAGELNWQFYSGGDNNDSIIALLAWNSNGTGGTPAVAQGSESSSGYNTYIFHNGTLSPYTVNSSWWYGANLGGLAFNWNASGTLESQYYGNESVDSWNFGFSGLFTSTQWGDFYGGGSVGDNYMDVDPSTGYAVGNTPPSSVTFYIGNVSSSSDYGVYSWPSGQSASLITGVSMYEGTLYVDFGSSGWYEAPEATVYNDAKANTSIVWTAVPSTTFIPFQSSHGGLSWRGNYIVSDSGLLTSPISATNVVFDAGEAGGLGGTTSGASGQAGSENKANTSTEGVVPSDMSGGGGGAGGNGGDASTPNGQNGGSIPDASIIGQQGGSGGYGGAGGGAGEIEIESSNPSQITGTTNTTTPINVVIPNTLQTMKINNGAMYTETPTVTIAVTGEDTSSNETLYLAQDASFTQNVKEFSLTGASASVGSTNYYTFSASESYTITGAINSPSTIYAKLVDSNGSSNQLEAMITPVADTTPPSVQVILDGNQPTTTQLPLQVNVVASDTVSSQGMQMMYSPDGQTWYNVVTNPLSSSDVDNNGNPISSGLVTATANASTTNPVFVKAQSATDVQPYAKFVTSFQLPSSPTVVDSSGTTISNNIWTIDTSITPNQIETGEYYIYLLVQDANKNQGDGANAIYYQNMNDTPNNPSVSSTSSGSSGGSSTPSGLLNNGSGGTIDGLGSTVTISGGSWDSIGNGTTTTTINGTTYTMQYANGVPTTPIQVNGELVDFNGVPTVVSRTSSVNLDVPITGNVTQYQISTNNGSNPTSWQQISNSEIKTPVVFSKDGLDGASLLVGNEKAISNWTTFPFLIDTATPTLSVKEELGGGGVSAGSSVELALSTSEPLGDVPLYYEVSVNNGAFSSWSIVPNSKVIDATVPNVGVNSVTVKVSDLAGNTNSDSMNILGL